MATEVRPPGRRRRCNNGLLYCAMICTTLVLIVLIGTFGK